MLWDHVQGKIAKNKPKKKEGTMVNNEKKWIVTNPFDVKWKNIAHLVDITTN
jgi:hypothetical protein